MAAAKGSARQPDSPKNARNVYQNAQRIRQDLAALTEPVMKLSTGRQEFASAVWFDLIKLTFVRTECANEAIAA